MVQTDSKDAMRSQGVGALTNAQGLAIMSSGLASSDEECSILQIHVGAMAKTPLKSLLKGY